MELSSEILKKIRRIELRAGHLVDDAFAGGYLSTFKGQGMEWEDVRHYVPGDDVRRIDWKVTARMGETQIKQFREEREIVIYVLIDVSGSGLFGSQDLVKSERLAELAAALAFCTTRNHDKLGVLFFSNRVERHIPPGSGQSHIFRVIREILTHQAGKNQSDKQESAHSSEFSLDANQSGHLKSNGVDHMKDVQTYFLPVVESLCKIRKKKTVVFVLSDFLMPDFKVGLERLARRHQTCLFWLRDKLEKELPQCGILPVVDAETGERAWIDLSSASARQGFRKLAQEREEALFKEARKRKSTLLCLDNNDTYIEKVVEFFKSANKKNGSRRL